MTDPIVAMRGIRKEFPGVVALDDVDFHIERGEIHALMGENGAGKSTLIKILTGMYRADAGEIRLDGGIVEPRSVFHMQSLGLSTIYQEINLVPNMSVCQNIALAREKTGPLRKIDWREARDRAGRALARLGLDIDVDKPLNRFSTAEQQMVAIARALSFDCKAVVMDEPTSSLNEGEIAALFALIRSLREGGMTFLFVSHKLREVFELCDSVTVLRDGGLVGRRPVGELDQYSLVSMMIGRDASEVVRARRSAGVATGARKICSLEGVRGGMRVRGLTFDIAEGEILGLAGLLGSGRTETLRMLFGADRPDAGVIRVDGVEAHFAMPRDAIRRHFAFCPEDRKVEGIMPSMSVADNIAVTSIRELSWKGIVSLPRKLALAREYIGKLNIKASSPLQPIRNMSGGNQQKAILARWLATRPRLLLLDEPTRGIDVGAKAEILDLVRRLAADGMSVLMVSSEWEELIQTCDRILVYRDGTNVASLEGDAMTEDAVIAAIAGGH
ncbi:MAG: sugar ABC transporter ATP-binding protein [Planctomycetota bacterium]|jgi:ribose transport system ATP-binding protein|nr:sugar ABC transporter ATP-binding protein [Planctomycetota bacterium]